MIHRQRASRRYRAYTKAMRKYRLLKQLEGESWYVKHFGMLRKGKIHCSCPMCAAKTNTRLSKSRGPVCSEMRAGWAHPIARGTRIPVTCARYGKKNYTAAEKRSIDRMRFQIREWEEAS